LDSVYPARLCACIMDLSVFILSLILKQSLRLDFKAGFLLAGMLTLVVAVLPTIYLAAKAAVANPLDSLRYE